MMTTTINSSHMPFNVRPETAMPKKFSTLIYTTGKSTPSTVSVVLEALKYHGILKYNTLVEG